MSSLNNKERYWQDFYNVLSQDTGLNCTLQNSNERVKVYSEEVREKMRQSKLGVPLLKPVWNKGLKMKPMSDETKLADGLLKVKVIWALSPTFKDVLLLLITI